ncbi:MAG: hypothetical protein H6719_25435 [Sandaracinaceae bacterium]|nr:hypothetical protein [Sandaracinaceae bacterium]
MAPRPYTRSTRAQRVTDLDPAALAALDAYRERSGLADDPRATAIACVRTDFDHTTRRWWGGTRTEKGTTHAILTPSHLITLLVDPSGSVSTIAYRVSDLEVRDYESSPGFQLLEDSGLSVTGFPPGASERSTYFVGLGPEPDAVAFRDAVRAALT